MRVSVFVACHRKRITVDEDGRIQGHWLGGAIARVLAFYGVDLSRVDFYYGDVADAFDRGGRGQYVQADLFSDEFLYAYRKSFDFVIYPDCGGAWFDSQRSGDTASFVALVQRLQTLARTALVVSKLIYPEPRRYVELTSTYRMTPGDELDYSDPYPNPGPDAGGSPSHIYIYDER